MLGPVVYYLSEHPAIVQFRWSHIHTWGSTWSFLFSSLSLYVTSSLALHLLIRFSFHGRTFPAGPVPALHSLLMALVSSITFSGIILSAAADLRDTRWLRHLRSPSTSAVQWLLCFPPGTRPSGRVFFWSYVFYLSRYLHMVRAFIAVLSRRRLSISRLFADSAMACTSFLWLEFSQSFQVLAILCATLVYTVAYGYRFWIQVGLPGSSFPVIKSCRLVIMAWNMACYVGVAVVHLVVKGGRGGCNGMRTCVFNCMLNGAASIVLVRLYIRVNSRKGETSCCSCGKRPNDSRD